MNCGGCLKNMGSMSMKDIFRNREIQPFQGCQDYAPSSTMSFAHGY
jgi:hypothetical protein